jgi:hypothetical protein
MAVSSVFGTVVDDVYVIRVVNVVAEVQPSDKLSLRFSFFSGWAAVVNPRALLQSKGTEIFQTRAM